MRHSSPAATIALTLALLCCPTAPAEPVNLLINGGAEQGKGELPSIWNAASVPGLVGYLRPSTTGSSP